MKALFDKVCETCSEITTKSYSTSFSLGIKLLDRNIQKHIYNIYGFVRFADEIVDTFHDFDKKELLIRFRKDTDLALAEKISLNPILNSFQQTVHLYKIDYELIDTFLKSMEMDLDDHFYNQKLYEQYILGSAEVVGLMCLKVFCFGDEKMYNQLKHNAMKLGSAFQKINFLRDFNADMNDLGRSYFPNVNMEEFNDDVKTEIEKDIAKDFAAGYQGIKSLPKNSRLGVYIAYIYYYSLFKKIQKIPASQIMKKRIRIPNEQKYGLFVGSFIKHQLNLI